MSWPSSMTRKGRCRPSPWGRAWTISSTPAQSISLHPPSFGAKRGAGWPAISSNVSRNHLFPRLAGRDRGRHNWPLRPVQEMVEDQEPVVVALPVVAAGPDQREHGFSGSRPAHDQVPALPWAGRAPPPAPCRGPGCPAARTCAWPSGRRPRGAGRPQRPGTRERPALRPLAKPRPRRTRERPAPRLWRRPGSRRRLPLGIRWASPQRPGTRGNPAPRPLTKPRSRRTLP